ncbi:Formiminotetrahydrofolate cyclodeaminase [Duganella sp. CF402]|uniref:cyclodeaminase/cyclohydrolase family protein n=1 Tax=unclassified Duganella TaxID=2636909 RepID=UPI0008AB2980|nr:MULTISPECIES: cyclodeaminase/cyclohydrolase family protein [unclassified Duganella]RZT09892.1 formiminotetrahydrofolate cyclodeaminase [Duganella sp. BK701]SEL38220.1 Formiminotetrahydrofolate cyclodeaminase [Duganella sp. CF402]
MSQQELLDSNTPLLSKPATELLSAFGSGKASPGSGSAAALMGLLSAKLILTVCSISKNKPECKKDDATFDIIIEKIREDIEPRLRELFESDARDFDRVVALRKLRDQATTSKEKSDFSRESNELLEKATDYAFEIAELSMRLIDHGIIIFDHGWHAVRGDSGAAISAAVSGVMSGIFIISLNLKTLKDRKYSRDKIARCHDLYLSMQGKQAAAFKCVTSINAEAISAVQLELPVGI